MSIFLPLIVVVLALVAEHYFPHWAEWTGHKLPSPVRLIVNYAAGSVAWFAPFTGWLVLNGYGRAAVIGWVFAVVAGLTVIFLYAIDKSINNKRDLLDAKEETALLERQKSNAENRS